MYSMSSKIRNLEAQPEKRKVQNYNIEISTMTDYGLNSSLKNAPINLRTVYSIDSQYAKLIQYEKDLRGSHPNLNRVL